MPVRYETLDGRAPLEAGIVDAGLDAFNHDNAPLHDVAHVTCVARDDAGDVIGGAVGRTWGNAPSCCSFGSRRRIGARASGRASCAVFEEHVAARGCTTCYLTTFSFQAPRLYRALGYRSRVGSAGLPAGHREVRDGPARLRSSHRETGGTHASQRFAVMIAAGALAAVALAQQPARPPFATTKVEGTDNVYIFRNGNHQAMFIVTDEGVIATDPVALWPSYRRADVRRRNPQGHQQADQVPDLQPPSLRSHRGRQGVQGCGRDGRRASQGEAAPGASRTRTPCCPTRRCPTAAAPSSSATRRSS